MSIGTIYYNRRTRNETASFSLQTPSDDVFYNVDSATAVNATFLEGTCALHGNGRILQKGVGAVTPLAGANVEFIGEKDTEGAGDVIAYERLENNGVNEVYKIY